MAKKKSGSSSSPKRKSRPLEVQLREDGAMPEAKKTRKQRIVSREEKDEFEADDAMDDRAKETVFALAKAQRDEERALSPEDDAAPFLEEDDDDDSGSEEEDGSEEDEGSDVSEGDVVEETVGDKLSESETRFVDAFLTPGATQRTFADVILAKIAEKEAERRRGGANAASASEEEEALPSRVVKAFSAMAPVLARYRSGKLPKALKVVPSLERWDEVLWLTRPDEWSPQCVLAATKVFASNLDPTRAKTFFAEILLERVKDDIRTQKKLNYHLYQALHKALFKPAAWFKGILLPLATAGDTTLREALIVGSILAKASIPPAHAAVVVFKLAQLKSYNGAASVFLVVLLNKKFALPVKVVYALVDHFLTFQHPRFLGGAGTNNAAGGAPHKKKHQLEENKLPVLWHQSLLGFVQRYKHDIPPDQRDKLKNLIKVQTHHAITPAIRRELHAAAAGGGGGDPMSLG